LRSVNEFKIEPVILIASQSGGGWSAGRCGQDLLRQCSQRACCSHRSRAARALGALYGAGGRDGGAIAVVSNQELMLNLVAPAATDTWNLLEILTDPA